MPWRLQEILYFFSIALQYKCFIYRDSFWKQLQFFCSFIIKNLALQYRQFIKYFHWQCYRFFVIEQKAKTKKPWQLPDFQRPSQSKTITIEFSLQKRSDLRVNKIHECFQLQRFESQQNYTQFIWKYQLNIDPDFSIKSNIFLGFPYMFDRTGLDIAQGIYNFYLNFHIFCTITSDNYFYFLSMSDSLKKLLSFLNLL